MALYTITPIIARCPHYLGNARAPCDATIQRLAHCSSSTILAYAQLLPRIFRKHVEFAEADLNTLAKTAAQPLHQSVVQPMNAYGLSY